MKKHFILKLDSYEGEGSSLSVDANDATTNRFGSGYVHGFVILRHGRFTVRSGVRPTEGK